MQPQAGHGRLIQGPIEVDIDYIYDVSARAQWQGIWTNPSPEHVVAAGPATLVLANGQRTEVVITRLTVRPSGGDRGEFVGRGRPPSH